jgi:hypothetical protein
MTLHATPWSNEPMSDETLRRASMHEEEGFNGLDPTHVIRLTGGPLLKVIRKETRELMPGYVVDDGKRTQWIPKEKLGHIVPLDWRSYTDPFDVIEQDA